MVPSPEVPSPDAPPPDLRGILIALAFFALGFIVVALIVHLSLPDPLGLYADFRSEKLVMLDNLQGTVYSAAFGSSHLHNGFSPVAFDSELSNRASGQPIETHTLNLAIEGGSQSEQRVMALQFVHHLATPAAPQPCLLLLELNAGANFTNDVLVHPRTIDIYDWQTARFVASLTAPAMSRVQRLGRVGYAYAATFLHYINVGMLSNRIFRPPLDRTLIADQFGQDRRGQKLLEGTRPGDHQLDVKMARQPKTYTDAPQAITPGNLALLDELQRNSPRRTLSFVYVVYPKFDDVSHMPDYPDHLEFEGRGVPILNLARPDRFPALYRTSLYHDEAHLDATGATFATRIVADRLKAWYAIHGQPAACGGR